MKQKLLLTLCVLITNTLSAQIINNFEQGVAAANLNSAAYRSLTSPIRGGTFSFVNCNVPTLFGNPFAPSTTVNNISSFASITTATTENFLLSNSIIGYTVGSGGGNYSLRLGNTNGLYSFSNPLSYNGARVSYTQNFVASTKIVSFNYFAYFNSPHFNQLNIQPLFTARLLDSNNNIIETTPVLCLKADSSDARLQTQGDITYMNQWKNQTYLIPDEYIGQNLKIQFVVTDCGNTGHRGIAYVDNILKRDVSVNDNNVFGNLNFETGLLTCPENEIEVCLNFIAPDGYVLNNLKLEVINTFSSAVEHTLTISNFTNNNNGTVCFEIDRDDLPTDGLLSTFKATAIFKTLNGYTHKIEKYSEYDPHLILGNSTPFVVTKLNSPIYGDVFPGSISWTDLNTSYKIEWISDETCCPRHAGSNTVNGVIHSLTTSDTNLDNLVQPMFSAINSKCFRFRIRPIGTCFSNDDWSDWCCVTTHTPNGGNYDPNDPNDPHNVCLHEIDFYNLTPSSQPKPIASPNPTTGNIAIVNSNSTVFDIYDLSYNKVKTVKTARIEEKVNIDFSELKPGIYILKLDNNQDIKIIKQ